MPFSHSLVPGSGLFLLFDVPPTTLRENQQVSNLYAPFDERLCNGMPVKHAIAVFKSPPMVDEQDMRPVLTRSGRRRAPHAFFPFPALHSA
jgi:hypothetical protein